MNGLHSFLLHVLKPTGLGVSHLNKLVHMGILGINQIRQNCNGSVFCNIWHFKTPGKRPNTVYDIFYGNHRNSLGILW